MADQDKPIQLNVKLYPGQDDDLIDWLETLSTRKHGQKAAEIRAALRRSIHTAGAKGEVGAAGDHHAGAAPPLDLAAIRQVVEAAVAAGLAHHTLVETGSPAPEGRGPEAAGQAEDLLGDLDAALVMG